MKFKTHSGAKKRMRPLPGGKVKRKQTRKRHLLMNRGNKAKRQLSTTEYVHSANMNQTERLFGL